MFWHRETMRAELLGRVGDLRRAFEGSCVLDFWLNCHKRWFERKSYLHLRISHIFPFAVKKAENWYCIAAKIFHISEIAIMESIDWVITMHYLKGRREGRRKGEKSFRHCLDQDYSIRRFRRIESIKNDNFYQCGHNSSKAETTITIIPKTIFFETTPDPTTTIVHWDVSMPPPPSFTRFMLSIF